MARAVVWLSTTLLLATPRPALTQPATRAVGTFSHRALNAPTDQSRGIRLPSGLPAGFPYGDLFRQGPGNDRQPDTDPTWSSLGRQLFDWRYLLGPADSKDGSASNIVQQWLRKQGFLPPHSESQAEKDDLTATDAHEDRRDGQTRPFSEGAPGTSIRSPFDQLGDNAFTPSRDGGRGGGVPRGRSQSGTLPASELLRRLMRLSDPMGAETRLSNQNFEEELSETLRSLVPSDPAESSTRRPSGNREGRESGGRRGRLSGNGPSAGGSAIAPDTGISHRVMESFIEAIDSAGSELIQAAQDPKRRQDWSWLSKAGQDLSRRLTPLKNRIPRPSPRISERFSTPGRLLAVPAPSVPTPPRGTLALLAVVALVTLVLGLTVRHGVWASVGGSRHGIRLPHAMPPSAILDRGTLVTACHRVAFRKLGLHSRFLNHRRLFQSLAQATQVSSNDLSELARLYERARYAPQDIDLTHEQLEHARKTLAAVDK